MPRVASFSGQHSTTTSACANSAALVDGLDVRRQRFGPPRQAEHAHAQRRAPRRPAARRSRRRRRCRSVPPRQLGAARRPAGGLRPSRRGAAAHRWPAGRAAAAASRRCTYSTTAVGVGAGQVRHRDAARGGRGCTGMRSSPTPWRTTARSRGAWSNSRRRQLVAHDQPVGVGRPAAPAWPALASGATTTSHCSAAPARTPG